MSSREYILPEGVAASGPYTPVIRSGSLVFISGQGTRDPKTGDKFLGAIERQAEIAMLNLKACAESAGLRMEDLVQVTVYLLKMDDLKVVNEVYLKFFEDTSKLPTRTCVAVAELPGSMSIEISALGHIQ